MIHGLTEDAIVELEFTYVWSNIFFVAILLIKFAYKRLLIQETWSEPLSFHRAKINWTPVGTN